jgi:hypothetical protein
MFSTYLHSPKIPRKPPGICGDFFILFTFMFIFMYFQEVPTPGLVLVLVWSPKRARDFIGELQK